MKRIALGLVAGLLMIACNSSTTSRPDSGGVTLMDSGMMMMGSDSGTRPDTGMMMMGGSCGSIMISASDWPALPAACTSTPRCSAATVTALNMCPEDDDGTCFNAAIEADTTTPATVTINGMAQALDCGTCYSFQQLSCAFDSCPMETIAFVGCDQTMDADMCNGEVTAVNACIMANQMAFQTCAQAEIGRCFPAAGGGGGEPEGAPAGADEARAFGFDLESVSEATLQRFSAAIAH